MTASLLHITYTYNLTLNHFLYFTSKVSMMKFQGQVKNPYSKCGRLFLLLPASPSNCKVILRMDRICL
jgi:hypothetical protein